MELDNIIETDLDIPPLSLHELTGLSNEGEPSDLEESPRTPRFKVRFSTPEHSFIEESKHTGTSKSGAHCSNGEQVQVTSQHADQGHLDLENKVHGRYKNSDKMNHDAVSDGVDGNGHEVQISIDERVNGIESSHSSRSGGYSVYHGSSAGVGTDDTYVTFLECQSPLSTIEEVSECSMDTSHHNASPDYNVRSDYQHLRVVPDATHSSCGHQILDDMGYGRTGCGITMCSHDLEIKKAPVFIAKDVPLKSTHSEKRIIWNDENKTDAVKEQELRMKEYVYKTEDNSPDKHYGYKASGKMDCDKMHTGRGNDCEEYRCNPEGNIFNKSEDYGQAIFLCGNNHPIVPSSNRTNEVYHVDRGYSSDTAVIVKQASAQSTRKEAMDRSHQPPNWTSCQYDHLRRKYLCPQSPNHFVSHPRNSSEETASPVPLQAGSGLVSTGVVISQVNLPVSSSSSEFPEHKAGLDSSGRPKLPAYEEVMARKRMQCHPNSTPSFSDSECVQTKNSQGDQIQVVSSKPHDLDTQRTDVGQVYQHRDIREHRGYPDGSSPKAFCCYSEIDREAYEPSRIHPEKTLCSVGSDIGVYTSVSSLGQFPIVSQTSPYCDTSSYSITTTQQVMVQCPNAGVAAVNTLHSGVSTLYNPIHEVPSSQHYSTHKTQDIHSQHQKPLSISSDRSSQSSIQSLGYNPHNLTAYNEGRTEYPPGFPAQRHSISSHDGSLASRISPISPGSVCSIQSGCMTSTPKDDKTSRTTPQFVYDGPRYHGNYPVGGKCKANKRFQSSNNSYSEDTQSLNKQPSDLQRSTSLPVERDLWINSSVHQIIKPKAVNPSFMYLNNPQRTPQCSTPNATGHDTNSEGGIYGSQLHSKSTLVEKAVSGSPSEAVAGIYNGLNTSATSHHSISPVQRSSSRSSSVSLGSQSSRVSTPHSSDIRDRRLQENNTPCMNSNDPVCLDTGLSGISHKTHMTSPVNLIMPTSAESTALSRVPHVRYMTSPVSSSTPVQNLPEDSVSELRSQITRQSPLINRTDTRNSSFTAKDSSTALEASNQSVNSKTSTSHSASVLNQSSSHGQTRSGALASDSESHSSTASRSRSRRTVERSASKHSLANLSLLSLHSPGKKETQSSGNKPVRQYPSYWDRFDFYAQDR